MCLLGDPFRAKVAKESSALLMTIQRENLGFKTVTVPNALIV